ncbi:MAG: 2'-5' RNA ligase [Brevundimonas sp.]|nr:MAG: 2'-5' RNA ligase [Brevundimonas sp.]
MPQPGLFGEPAMLQRLFFAVKPDAETAGRISALGDQLKRAEGLSGKAIKTERLHITLIHVGDWDGLPKGVVDDCQRVGEATDAGAFEVAFDRAQSFSGATGNRPYVLLGNETDLAAVKSFRADLLRRLASVGVKPKSNLQFNPHVTLLYDPKLAPERAVEPIRWRARDLLLIHSEIGLNKYHELGRWPLETRS